MACGRTWRGISKQSALKSIQGRKHSNLMQLKKAQTACTVADYAIWACPNSLFIDFSNFLGVAAFLISERFGSNAVVLFYYLLLFIYFTLIKLCY